MRLSDTVSLTLDGNPAPWREDPYETTSWPSKSDEYTQAARARPKGVMRGEFQARYRLGERIKMDGGARIPLLNRVGVVERDPQFVRRLRDAMPYGDGLVIKTVHLTEKSENPGWLGEREVQVAYHLRELVHGYSQLLSLHFMMVLDWWMAPLGSVHIRRIGPPFKRDVPCHFVVSERLDQTLRTRLEDDATPYLSLDELRVLLFQLFSALELAWLTHRFVHGDPHTSNLMLKHCTEGSVLHNRAWLYRRYNDPDYWYVLPPEAHQNRLLKLIDFDHSSLNAPLSKRADRPLGGARHVHPVRQGDLAWDLSGKLDAHHDAAYVLRYLQPGDEWKYFGYNLDWDYWFESDPEATGQLLDLSQSPQNEVTASRVLNHKFFSPLRRRFTERETRALDLTKLTNEHIVVSFATSFAELNARGPPDLVVPIEPEPGPADGGLTFGAQFHAHGPSCVVCGLPAQHVTRGPTDAYMCAGRTCYEFQHCFRRQTAVQ
jgi:hypothetical protein